MKTNGDITFREHVILKKDPSVDAYGVQYSQLHSLALIDMDGDGLKDIVSGKRFWAHGKHGPDPQSDGAPAVLMLLVQAGSARAPGQAEFVPHLIDSDSGVGTQVTAGFVSNEKFPDVVVGNKKGVFIFKHQAKEVPYAEWEAAQPKPILPKLIL